MRIKTRTGEPPFKGYYMVVADPQLNTKQRDKYPQVMYWNGKEWQDMSDDDVQKAWGESKPCTFDLKWFPKWFELQPLTDGTFLTNAAKEVTE